MAYNVDTSAGALSKLWKKVQGKLFSGINHYSEEWESLGDLKSFDIDVSAREMTFPIDINRPGGVASIAEGDFEATPSTVSVEEATVNYVQLNKRFTASIAQQILSSNHAAAEVTKVLVYQGKKALEALAADYSDRFYGFSTGVLAISSTVATGSSGTYTVSSGYGSSLVTDKAFITGKFQVGEGVALVRTGALVANAIGTITAIDPVAGTLAISWMGSVTSAAGDLVVKANSVGQTTLAHTDYNRSMTGMLDIMLSTSVHGLSKNTIADWAPALVDATGGRLSPVRIEKAKDAIANLSGLKADRMLWTHGVRRDVMAQLSTTVRFGSPFELETGIDVNSKGLKQTATRRVPPGMTFIYSSEAIRRLNVHAKPTAQVSYGDAVKLQDKSGYVFGMDFITQNVVTNRRGTSLLHTLDEQ